MKKITIEDLNKRLTITIKSPTLRRIRNNLRELWLCKAHEAWDRLQGELNKLYYEDDGLFKQQLSGAEIELVRSLNEKINLIKRLVDNSICKCRRCVRTDQDMTYNPRDGAWYCVECYGEMQKRTAKKKTGESFLYP